jgi:hypothetical protein
MHIYRGHDLIRRLMLTARKQGVGDFNALMCRGDAVRTQAF